MPNPSTTVQSTEEFEFAHANLGPPLPRTWQWLDGSAFHSHGALMQRAFKHDFLDGAQTRPLMYQGGSDDFLGPCEDMPLPSEADGIDFEAELAVVVDRVPMGTSSATALEHVKLVMLANDASLRSHAVPEMKTGFGWIHAKPATSFSPVAVTPDELGAAWKAGRVHLPMRVSWNGRAFGHPPRRGNGIRFPRADRPRGVLAQSERRDDHRLRHHLERELPRPSGRHALRSAARSRSKPSGHAVTEYMRFGDRVRIEMLDANGNTIFGAIDQRIVPARR